MRRLLVGCVAAMAAGAVVSLAFGASEAAQGKWIVRDLGIRWSDWSADGTFLSTPHLEINAKGQILGEGRTVSGRRYTFLWRNGEAIRLPFAAGEPMPDAVESGEGEFVGAPSFNDRGQVVGVVRRAGAESAVLWEDGKTRRVGAANGALINNRGQVVAWSSDGHWLLWESGIVRARGRIDSSVTWRVWDEQGAIVGINERGQIAGRALPGAPDHSWLWRKGRTTDLGTPPPDDTYPARRFATDLNERGQVVGFDIPGNVFLWQNGEAVRIPPGSKWRGESVTATDVSINDRGQIVGSYGGGWWLWEGARLRVADGNAWKVAINNRGQVVGLDGDAPAFIWENGKVTRLPLLPGDSSGGALALNEREQIVGISCTFNSPTGSTHEGGTLLCRSVLWTRQPAK
jgi:uncharacterized membrane protein